MITNQFISPHPLLKPFVSNYILSTSHGLNTTFRSHWAASNEISLIFYLGNQPNHKHKNDDSILSGKKNCIVGLLTRYNGVIDFNGMYHTFIIQFELNGINKLFGISMPEFTNKIFSAENVFGKNAGELHDQLANAVAIQQMAILADAFLLPFLNRHAKKISPQDCILYVSQRFYNNCNLLSVTEYAGMVNMSVKNFERQFLEQTGVFPKLYLKLLRFNEAIKIKTMHPCKSFTSIAYECGYFDQMHFIRDFKQFTDLNPHCFFTKNMEFGMPRIYLKQAIGSIFKQLNNHLQHEEFVSVSRIN